MLAYLKVKAFTCVCISDLSCSRFESQLEVLKYIDSLIHSASKKNVYVVLALAYIYIPNNTIALTFSDKTNTLFWRV